MKTSEIIGVGIVVILAMIFISMIWPKEGAKITKTDLCNKLCHQIGTEKWFFLESPVDRFDTKNECISACLIKKQH